ncbi:SGNH/GDSL hydrolase family protein, partial [Enterococcus villorum]
MELDKFREVDLVIDHVNNHFFQNQFVSQNDNAGRSLTVQVTNNGVIGEVPGLTLNLRWHNRNSGLTDLSPF